MRIGTYFGIPLKVNPFFFLFLGIAFFYGRIVEALVLFAVVLWHETFHVVVAKLYRLDVIDIELLPFGGVARLEALLQLNPQREWVIAIAGPLSNILLVFLGTALLPYLSVSEAWFNFFTRANAGMAVFNLLPVLPLDGGRILRSVLVQRWGFKRATDALAGIGQVLSAALAAWGCFALYLKEYSAVIFLFIGLTLFVSARQERKNADYVFMRYLTHKKRELRLKRAFSGYCLITTAETSLGEVLREFQPPHYHLVWILDLEGTVLGFLGELELIQALFEQGMSCKMGSLVKYKV